jgi:hypothetical protein
MLLAKISGIARSKGDPRVERTGPSSLTSADRLARGLGWLSVGLGVVELVAAGPLARSLGLHGREGLIRAYGARELASAIPTLSIDKDVGLGARIAGDMLDLATLASAFHPRNRKRDNVALATAIVLGITLLDVIAYGGVKAAHSRQPVNRNLYANRSGLPRGPGASRGLARKDFETPPDYRAPGTVATEVPVRVS